MSPAPYVRLSTVVRMDLSGNPFACDRHSYQGDLCTGDRDNSAYVTPERPDE
jgi:hypothetical protein